MTSTGLLNIAGLLAVTVGALLILLYLWKSPRFAADWLSPEGQIAYAKHRRLLIIGMALLAVWLVIQYAAVILT
jgi:hypothetical protein